MFASINRSVKVYLADHPYMVDKLIAVWTLLQSMSQLTWILFLYSTYNCSMRPTSYDMVFLYLTYFYRNVCGPIYLKNVDSFLSETSMFWFIPMGNGTELYLFVKDVLQRGVLPKSVVESGRAIAYIQTSLVFESFWAFASIVLLVGAFMKIKQYWVILYYGPWLVTSALNVLLDAVSAVHFGLDIRLLGSYTKWLEFIGVQNFEDFKQYDSLRSSSSLPTLPAVIFVLLFSRIFVVWILNILCFMKLLHKYMEIFQTKSRSRRNRTTRLSCANGQEIDLNTSEARIRNWQLFYGAIGSTSTLATGSSSDEERKKVKDISLPSTSGEPNKRQRVVRTCTIKPPNERSCEIKGNIYKQQSNISTESSDSFDNHDIDNKIDEEQCTGRPSIDSVFSTYYCKLSDPNYPEDITSNPVLRNQLPWSYIGPKDVRNIDTNNIRKHHIIREQGSEV